MEQFRRAFSPPTRTRSVRSTSPEKYLPPTTLRTEMNQSDPSSLTTLPVLQPPPLHPPIQSADPSPGHSRPASVSHSVAHPQMFAEPSRPLVSNRRGSSFSTPLNPYAPTPMYPVAILTLMATIHLGILIVMGIMLAEFKKTTAEFHTASNNSTGSYFRVGLYGGGLGAVNRPFYTSQVNGSAMGLLPSF